MSDLCHFLTVRNLDRHQIDNILNSAHSYSKGAAPQCPTGKKLLASAFFEPSLRTQTSFEAAMIRIGGHILGARSTSGSRANASHEESLSDSARVMSGYADVIVFRHGSAAALKVYADHSEVPVINAGNGNGSEAEHPTQALCDLYTIKQHFGQIDGLTVGIVGSLQKRAVRSLLHALSNYKVRILIPNTAPIRILLEDEVYLSERDVDLIVLDSVEDLIKASDVIYHGGLAADWQQQLGEEFFLTADRLKGARAGAIVMHPMPRPGSISTDVDKTIHAKYFDCAKNGVAVRMAVLGRVLQAEGG